MLYLYEHLKTTQADISYPTRLLPSTIVFAFSHTTTINKTHTVSYWRCIIKNVTIEYSNVW